MRILLSCFIIRNSGHRMRGGANARNNVQSIFGSGIGMRLFGRQRKAKEVGGLPYMTSTVGGGRGVTKKQTKVTKSADL